MDTKDEGELPTEEKLILTAEQLEAAESLRADCKNKQRKVARLREQVAKATQQCAALENELAEAKKAFFLETSRNQDAKLASQSVTQIAQLRSAREKAESLVRDTEAQLQRLEAICGLRGVDPENAINAPRGDTVGADLFTQYQALLEEEKEDSSKSGAAHKFWRKHKKELEALG